MMFVLLTVAFMSWLGDLFLAAISASSSFRVHNALADQRSYGDPNRAVEFLLSSPPPATVQQGPNASAVNLDETVMQFGACDERRSFANYTV